jgi:hypothetical protein
VKNEKAAEGDEGPWQISPKSGITYHSIHTATRWGIEV